MEPNDKFSQKYVISNWKGNMWAEYEENMSNL